MGAINERLNRLERLIEPVAERGPCNDVPPLQAALARLSDDDLTLLESAVRRERVDMTSEERAAFQRYLDLFAEEVKASCPA